MLKIITWLDPPSGHPAVIILAGHEPDDSQHARELGRLCEHFGMLTTDNE